MVFSKTIKKSIRVQTVCEGYPLVRKTSVFFHSNNPSMSLVLILVVFLPCFVLSRFFLAESIILFGENNSVQKVTRIYLKAS